MPNSITATAEEIVGLARRVQMLSDACDPPPIRSSPSLDPRHPLQGTSKAARENRRAMRIMLLERDGPNCCHCGAQMVFPAKETPDMRAHPHFASIEHLTEFRNGGGDDPENLRLACSPCNQERDQSERQTEFENVRHTLLHRLLRAHRHDNAIKLSCAERAVLVEEIFELNPGAPT